MSKNNIVLAYNLKDTEVEIINRFKDEFLYETISTNDLNDLNNNKFMIAFVNLDNADDKAKNILKEALKNTENTTVIIGKWDDEASSNNPLLNSQNVRLEILKAYQKYIKIEKANKPFSLRLKRLVHMIRLFENQKIITLDELIKCYRKDKRTILRDISFLRGMGVDIIYDKQKKAYVLMKEYRPNIWCEK